MGADIRHATAVQLIHWRVFAPLCTQLEVAIAERDKPLIVDFFATWSGDATTCCRERCGILGA